jgi:hypothetical protein
MTHPFTLSPDHFESIARAEDEPVAIDDTRKLVLYFVVPMHSDSYAQREKSKYLIGDVSKPLRLRPTNNEVDADITFSSTEVHLASPSVAWQAALTKLST